MEKPATPLPCPFCGSNDIEPMPRPFPHGMRCLSCKAEVTLADTEAEAIAAWNRRVPDLTAINAELVEALERMLAESEIDGVVSHEAEIQAETALARAALAARGLELVKKEPSQ